MASLVLFRFLQNSIFSGLHPDPAGGAYDVPPDPIDVDPRYTGDLSEFDTKNYLTVVLVFQERYGHKGLPHPASVNIIDLT